MADKVLFNREAEESLIGAVLIDPWLFEGLPVTPGDFFIERHRWIWETFTRLNDERTTIDLVTVSDDMQKHNRLQDAGGLPFLAHLVNAPPSSQHAPEYAAIVRDFARRRLGAQMAQELAEAAFDTTNDFQNEQAQMLDKLGQANRPDGGAVPVRVWLEQGFNAILENQKNPGGQARVRTGFKDLDEMTGGLRPGVFLIGGSPGTGKTILVENIATWNGGQGVPGVLYSAEMSAQDMTYRILSERANLAEDKLMAGKLTEGEFQALGEIIGKVQEYPLFVSDNNGMTTGALRADLTRLKLEQGIQWFAFDYLELLDDTYGRTEQDRTAYLSRQIVRICKELGLVGIVVQMMTKEGFSPGASLGGFRGPSNLAHDVNYAAILTEHIPPPGAVQEDNLKTLQFKKSRFRLHKKRPVHLYKHPEIPRFYDPALRTTVDLSRI